MGLIGEAEIKSQIKSCSFGNLYLVFGNEPYLKQFYCNKIIEKAINPDFAAFNCHIFDGNDVDLKEVSECVEALPMMDERKIVVVKDFNLSSLNQSQNEIFSEIVSDVPGDTLLLFWMQTVDVDIKKNDKWKKISQLVEKHGNVLVLNKKGTTELKKMLVSGAQKRGKVLSPQLAEYFVNTVGDDLNILLNELEKLCFYCESIIVEKEHIDSIITRSVEASVFDLAKLIISGNRNGAFKNLSALIANKTDPININAALISAYVDMYRAKVYVTSGFQAEEAAKYYNYRNKEFRLRNGLRDASKMSLQQLRTCLEILSETDIKLKSTSADKSILLEETIVKLILTANGEKV